MRYLRLFYILWIMASYRLDIFIAPFKSARKIAWLLRLLFLLNPVAWFRNIGSSRGERLRLALIKLGPIFVKFGQVLSTRPDLFPDDIVIELAKLQDQVPNFSSQQSVKILKHAYQQPLENIFKHFELKPLASASIAQVHAATLLDGSDIVVKIVRPHIRKTIDKDISVLYLFAELANKSLAQAKLLRLTEVVAEFEKTILNELDMRKEADNANRLRDNFLNSKLLYVPRIYWPYVRENILVMERIYGIRISEIETLKAQGANLKKLAQDGVEIFYTQVFRDKFFHADMHPGNIFVNIDDPKNPIYCGIDFGIMGILTDDDCHYMAENFLAFFNRNYRQIAQLHIDAGWVPENTDITAFTQALRDICDPMFKKPLNEISFGQVLVNLLKVAQQFNMIIQPQLVLLQKTLLNVEGLGRQLYPQLDLWETAKPVLEKIMGKKLTLRDRLTLLKTSWKNISCDLEKLPQTIKTLLSAF